MNNPLGRKNFEMPVKAARKVLSALAPRKRVRKALVYPVVEDADVLGDLLNRLSWYLPEHPESPVEIYIPLSDSLLRFGDDLSLLKQPDGQFRYIKQSSSLKFIKASEARQWLRQTDRIILWDSTCLKTPRILRYLGKVSIVDPGFSGGLEMSEYMSLYLKVLGEEVIKGYKKLSLSNFIKFIDEAQSFKDAYLFLTGPSVDQAFEFNFPDDTLKVLCNAMAKNREVVEHIKPNVYAIADPVFFGPSLFAQEIRGQILGTVRRHKCYFIIPEEQVPLIMHQNPDLSGKLVGMPTRIWSRKWNIPTPDKFFVKSTLNILSMYMLPVASAVADSIFMLGADGRKADRDEKADWDHSKALLNDELLETIYNTHPTWYSDKNFNALYEAHCRSLEAFIEFGESRGKRYYSLAESHIPVLKERYRPDFTGKP